MILMYKQLQGTVLFDIKGSFKLLEPEMRE